MSDVHLIGLGDFGRAVVDQLARYYRSRTSSPYEVEDSSRWPRSRLQVVACWRESPRLFDLADRVSVISQRPWLPIVLDGRSLRVGPLGLGAQAPCYRCFLARQFQHRRLLPADRGLLQAYDQDAGLGVSGYLPAHVGLATSAARMSIDAVLGAATGQERGRVRRFGLLDPSARVDTVVPVAGCSRCGHERPDATWGDLARDMQRLPTPAGRPLELAVGHEAAR